jgi:Helix-turn-helix domain
MKALPLEVRTRVLAALDGGMSRAAAVDVFQVSLGSIKRWLRARAAGDLAPKRSPGRPRRIALASSGIIVLALLICFAIWQGITQHPLALGRQCQVNRTWGKTMHPSIAYSLWGVLLGCGIATPIYHSVFVVLLGGQLLAGISVGALSGALFGIAREVAAL